MAERLKRSLVRGDVYIVQAPLPDRDAGTGVKTKHKWVVLLHGDKPFTSSNDVAVIVASTDRRAEGWKPTPFEVVVGEDDGFESQSVFDCRWPFTMLKADIRRGTYKTTLSDDQMEAIAEAIVVGLLLA